MIAKIGQYVKEKREQRTAVKNYRAINSIQDKRVQQEVLGMNRHMR